MPPEPALPAAARIAATSPGAASGTRLRVSPLARRVAGRLGIDLAAVRGTGRGRAVTLADVEQAAGARQAAEAAPAVAVSQAPAGAPVRAPAAAPTAPIAARPPDRATAMRQATGALMARSKREIPHYYLETTIDLGAALDWLAAGNVGLSPARRLIPAALLLAATARAARAVPRMNGFFLDGEVQEAERIHLGVAIALRGGGLVAPALHDADTATPAELMAALAGTTTRARTGMLRASEMTDATLTVTNLGELGADKVNGVIHPPQIALVGFGAIRRRPWVVDGALTIRPLVVATLAADHRASDGQDGSRFLAKLDALLQRPEAL
ncbi:MAG TPA: 2-oxo acid dehydrogenase subunit E2 [Conexibacter sp.]|nr:2-oxo acid dehydrogenase subunit E2 [Conexibacter sp.]